jgi:rhodanese-related sulfurtransferase
MVTAGIWIVTFALIALFFYLRFRPVAGLRHLDAEAFQTALQNEKNRILIDVREPSEYSRGHLEGAVNMPLSHLAGAIYSVPRDTAVFLYCRSGMRGQQAGRMLSGQGYLNLLHLKGGISAWRGPVVKE